MNAFVELFQSYWWLLVPLAFFIFAGWNSFMSYKRTQAKVELLKAYAKSGNTPPPELVSALNQNGDADGNWHKSDDEGSGGGSTAFLVILFGGLAGVFTYVGYSGWLGDTTSMYFVAMILGVLAVAFLFGGLFGRRRRK
ncbi:hypothetical protein [Hyphobacterium sp.]|jgi:hypothetical protein|uniref:hypothetical protein n=1 Tax=Hyphobacterium sp. TaxID=2004662 RepID=UPI003BACADF5